jgi:hypothetical protein
MKQVTDAIQERRELIKSNILKGFAQTLKEDASIKKAVDSEENEDVLEKGQINDSMLGYDSKINFKKKGSDIIAMLNASLISVNTKIKEIEKQIEDKKEKIGSECNPTQKCDSWRMGAYKDKISCPYMTYDWNLTYYSDSKSISDATVMQDGESVSKSTVTKESAKLCSEYNQLVSMWIEMKVDAEAINVLVNNLDAKTTYDLTAKQLAAIQM